MIAASIAFYIVWVILLVVTVINVGRGITNHRYKKTFQGGVLLWLIAIVLEIMHLPGANIAFIVGAMVLFMAKALSLTSQMPVFFDFIILLWLAVYLTSRIVAFMHLAQIPDAVTVIEIILFAIVAVRVFYNDNKEKNA